MCVSDAYTGDEGDRGRVPEAQAGDAAGGTPAPLHAAAIPGPPVLQVSHLSHSHHMPLRSVTFLTACLLYTSDAADER